MLNAIVLIKATPAQVSTLGPALAALDGVSEVYSVTGDDDLVALLHSNDTEQVARLVTERIATLDGVLDTRTLIAFRQYDPADISF
ncbi:MAG TPA: Lrp/AsnC ligand binding domain-containing protein [Acidimicrobiia bacterium]|nr:Lrp/AsnC ligand binding domain-containing protein [Acidimicrobiia bacterium]HYL53137.1 Lrp/AsnC ligand binding domain-containing protein [Acidimicrobiia bacterium]